MGIFVSFVTHAGSLFSETSLAEAWRRDGCGFPGMAVGGC